MKRGKFSLSNYKLLSCDLGELIPCGAYEVLPGDTIQHSTSALLRTQPLLAPVMHPVEVRIHHWYVPYRLIWADFEKFITGGPDGLDASVYPTINVTFTAGSPDTGIGIVGGLADYLGVPTKINNLVVSALPFRAYALVFNEFYRDEDLVTPLVISTASGVDSTTNTLVKNVAWEKDYFTSARPWEQKGPAITIPLGTSAPVNRVANAPQWRVYNAGTNTLAAANNSLLTSVGAAGLLDINSGQDVSLSPETGGLAADLTGASAITVNALRSALALQRYEENRARFGSRYVEYLRYLGVRSSDARLNRPEYLGGGRNTIQFSEVLATAETGTSVDVGDMKGHGIASMRSNRFRRFFEEHGIVLSFLSVRPRTMYSQGLFKMWNRRVKEDFWQQELQHIGQQAIKNKEIYAAGASPEATFGYQDRFDEYRRQESTIAGEFRDTTLNYWHFARDFGSAPALNSAFVTSTPTERVFPAPTADVLYVMARHSVQARRLVASTGSSFIF